MARPVTHAWQTFSSWFFTPFPRGRIAALRTILYLFIFVDVFLTTSWVMDHNGVPTELYQPLWIGRWLPLPEPTEFVVTFVMIGLLLTAAVGATGRFPRTVGTAIFLFYLQWMFIAMSYGKVDHDRISFLIALAVLPTVGAARWGDRSEDEASGWAIRFIQIGVVATYFLSTFAKLRFGGWGWVNGATLMRAVLRRGTFLGDQFVNFPWVLHISQWIIVAFELLTPLMLLRNKIGYAFVAAAILFHLMTYSTISIIFLPQVMCLFAFLPLERIDPRALLSRLAGRGTARAGSGA
jgi:hypothetical protein